MATDDDDDDNDDDVDDGHDDDDDDVDDDNDFLFAYDLPMDSAHCILPSSTIRFPQ